MGYPERSSMRRFWVMLFGVTALCHLPFVFGARRLLEMGGVSSGWGWVVAGLVAAGLVGLLAGRVNRARLDRPIGRWRRLLVEEPYFVHWGAAVLSVVVCMPLLVLSWGAGLVRGGGMVFTGSVCALGAYGVSFLVSGWGVLVRRRWVRVRTVDMDVAGLPASFEGYRIAQLSDLHIGSMCPRSWGDAWVARVNALDVDMVALTGDYVTSGSVFHRDIADMFSALRARDGVFAVMGNHDYFGDGEGLARLIGEGGVRVLRNEWTVVSRGGDEVTLAGVDDTWTRRADVIRTVAGAKRGAPLIVLSHDPSLFPKFAKAGAAVVLSGHTHWGQIAVPFMPTRYNLSRVSYRYHAGMYRERGAVLYIHPGLGTTGPPIRLGAAPEITVLRLRRA